MRRTTRFVAGLAGTGLAAGAALYGAPATGAGVTTLVSLSGDERQGDGSSYGAVISADGRYVGFTSYTGNFSGVDTNRRADVYLRDRVLGSTELISVGTAGSAATGEVTDISPDGRFVVFTSTGAGLVDLDNNGVEDVFVRDRVTRTTDRISLENTGEQSHKRSYAGSISADGRYVAFVSEGRLARQDGDSLGPDVYLRDRQAGTTKLVSITRAGRQGNGELPVISDNGRFVTFTSRSGSLVKGDTNHLSDVFVRDLAKSSTRRVSLSSGGSQGNAISRGSDISSDGRFVVFTSRASNLVKADRNKVEDVFLRNRVTGTTKRVSVTSSERPAGGPSIEPAVSDDGRYVLFRSSPDLQGGGGPEALYLRDVTGGQTHLLVVNIYRPAALDASGHEVAFSSDSPDMVAGDVNGYEDVFVYAW